jgi:hypothetical protein
MSVSLPRTTLGRPVSSRIVAKSFERHHNGRTIGTLFARLLVIAAALVAVGAAQSRELTDVSGAIEAVNPQAGWYAIVPDGDRGTRYAPDRLPDEFKKDGLRVVFSGRVGRVDPNVRTWGIPLTLTKIAREPAR